MSMTLPALGIAAVLAVLGATWLASRLKKTRRLLHDVAESHRAISLRATEIVHIQKRRQQAVTTARTARDMVSISASATQGVHKGISGLVFGALGAIPALRDGSNAVKTVHDTTADGVYDVIRLVDRIDFEDS